jgi:hypothetical protein
MTRLPDRARLVYSLLFFEMSTLPRLLCSTTLQYARCSLLAPGNTSLGACSSKTSNANQSLLTLLPATTRYGRSTASSSLAKSTATRHATGRGACNLRQLWTRASRTTTLRQNGDQASDEASFVEKIDSSRISSYSSISGKFSYAKTLGELASEETAIDALLKSKDKGDAQQNSVEMNDSKPWYWLDVLEPTSDEIVHLCSKLGVHSLTTEDILTEEKQEKLEIHPGV